MGELICPYCGLPLIIEGIDSERYNIINFEPREVEVSIEVLGNCPQCKHHYEWIEVYTFNHVKNFKDIT